MDDELKTLVLELKSEVKEGFNNLNKGIQDLDKRVQNLDKRVQNLDKEVQVGFAKVEGEFKRVDVELKRIEEKTDNGMKEIKQTLDTKSNVWEKRLENAEFVGKATMTAIVIGFVGGLAKILFF